MARAASRERSWCWRHHQYHRLRRFVLFLQQIIADFGLQLLNTMFVTFGDQGNERGFCFLKMSAHGFQHPLETCQLLESDIELFSVGNHNITSVGCGSLTPTADRHYRNPARKSATSTAA